MSSQTIYFWCSAPFPLCVCFFLSVFLLQIIIPPESPVPVRKVLPPLSPPAIRRPIVEEPKQTLPVQRPPVPIPPPPPPPPSPPPQPPHMQEPVTPPRQFIKASPPPAPIHEPPAPKPQPPPPVVETRAPPVQPMVPVPPKVLVSVGCQTEYDPVFPSMQAWTPISYSFCVSHF